ncbi:MAG: acyltransferase [Rubrivivax sp.]
MNAPHDRQAFVPIEGLRGFLALWVALGHGLQSAGHLLLPGPLNLLLRGEEAVNVFVIISGFVITHLLQVGREAYGPYLLRRFCRLYPLFVVACVAGYLAMALWPALVLAVPWRDQPGWPGYAGGVLEIVSQSRENLWPHALLHATMLHGLVPMEWLPVASKTLLPATWSISLEWQFYLVAPLVLLSLRRPLGTLCCVLAVCGLTWLYRHGALGSYAGASALFMSAGYFAVGMASRLGFAGLQRLVQQGVGAGPLALIAVLLLYTLVPGHLALVLWLPFLCLLAAPQDNRAFRAAHGLLTAPAVLRLGLLSYSVYLLHRPVQVLLGWLLLQWQAQPSQAAMLAVQVLAIGLTVAVSALTWRWIEVPGQALGRRLARCWPPAAAGAAAAAPDWRRHPG